MYIESTIPIIEFKIIFSYVTKRGNKKEREAIVKNISEEAAREAFNLGIADYNARNKHRSYSNVQILEIKVNDIDSITI
nr:hypothetical protein [uncultured Cellulosilyticum sp.]